MHNFLHYVLFSDGSVSRQCVTGIAGNKKGVSMIEEKLNEWCKGKKFHEQVITVFEHIRDIPYYIIPDLRNHLTGPEKLLELRKGSCIPKHFLMGKMFKKLGVKVKYVSMPFQWASLDVAYPEELRQLAAEMPLGSHLACKAVINGKDVLVDATWDIPMKKVGFPVNEKWDGKTDMIPAVRATDEILHETEVQWDEYIKEVRGSWKADDYEKEDIFIAKFNAWLEQERAK